MDRRKRPLGTDKCPTNVALTRVLLRSRLYDGPRRGIAIDWSATA